MNLVETALKENEHDIKLAVISHITSTPAVIYPVKRLTALFHEYVTSRIVRKYVTQTQQPQIRCPGSGRRCTLLGTHSN